MQTTYTLTRETRTDFATMGDPTSRYEREYWRVTVWGTESTPIGYGFVDSPTDQAAINREVREVLEWANVPSSVIESMHSRYD